MITKIKGFQENVFNNFDFEIVLILFIGQLFRLVLDNIG